MSGHVSASSRLRDAIDALGRGEPARLDPKDLCEVLHENERLQSALDRMSANWIANTRHEAAAEARGAERMREEAAEICRAVADRFGLDDGFAAACCCNEIVGNRALPAPGRDPS